MINTVAKYFVDNKSKEKSIIVPKIVWNFRFIRLYFSYWLRLSSKTTGYRKNWPSDFQQYRRDVRTETLMIYSSTAMAADIFRGKNIVLLKIAKNSTAAFNALNWSTRHVETKIHEFENVDNLYICDMDTISRGCNSTPVALLK